MALRRRPSLLLALLPAILLVNEARAFKLQLASKRDIMASMTAEAAVKVVMRMRGTHDRPELVALIQDKLGHRLRHGHRKAQLRFAVKQGQDPSGYAALDNAKKILNSMMEETNMKEELEQIRCQNFETEQMRVMEETQQDVASFNALAAESRGHVLKAQAAIMKCNDRLPVLQNEMEEVGRQCTMDVSSLKASLKIVLADIDVMGKVLDLTRCGDATTGGIALIQCAYCQGGGGNGMVMIQEDNLQPLFEKLRSAVARQYLQEGLARSYHEAVSYSPPVMLTQERVARATRHVQMPDRGGLHFIQQAPTLAVPPVALDTSDEPQAPEPHDCIPTTKCTLSDSPNCERLRDRFLVIHAGIKDKKNELSQELVDLEEYCERTTRSYDDQITQLQDQLREEQTNLAMATKDQVEAAAQSHVKGAQHGHLVIEYQDTMKKCCDNQNEMKSENCALEKIRGELYKMEGQNVFIADCEVTDWRPEECSVTCGGGTQVKTRSVIVHPVGGTACPPLHMEEACNQDACPVDCVVDDWAGWSACSAECGGGVRMRTRATKVRPQHGGTPCGATEEADPCNVQACDQDCALSDWSPWGLCSKACGGGSFRRQRSIQQPARGTGICFEPESDERLEFHPCNQFTCESMLAPLGRTTLLCDSVVDVVLMLDGSGSLGTYGWAKTKEIGSKLVQALMGGGRSVKLAIQLFSGPTSWTLYEKCTSSSPDVSVDLARDCGIVWVKHFTDSLPEALAAVQQMVWPSATTLTSVALAEAGNQLINGREAASSVVICVTDGKPMSAAETKAAALRLQQKARVVWVPLGSAAPLDLIMEMASKPESDHVVPVRVFADMANPLTINRIIADTCPVVK